MLEKVKRALRISHSSLDEDINEAIAAARAELIRAGVAAYVAEADDIPLITQAIKTYCLSVFTDDNTTAERYSESFKYQLDNLRKSTDYREE